MRIPFATTAASGHFRPLVPFAEACVRAGHDVMMAGQAGAASAVEREGFAFQPLAEPDEEQIAGYQAGQASVAALEQAVPKLLSDPRYRDRVRAIAAEIQTLAPIDEAPDVLAALADPR